MMKSLYFTVKHFQISIMYSRSTCNRYKNMHQSPDHSVAEILQPVAFLIF